MKLVYKGQYTAEGDLPVRVHPAGSVPFRELGDMQQLAKVLNLLSLPLFGLTVAGFLLRGWSYFPHSGLQLSLGLILPMLTLFPHELLHAVCFRGEVELWTNFKMGMLFVVGTEDLSKTRFVVMSLLPNLLFGFVPYVLFLLHPRWVLLGALGAISLPMGIGDYYNVYNCLTQVPKGAVVYLSGMHSFWYVPAER